MSNLKNQTDPFKSILRPRIREQLPNPLKEASTIQLARALIDRGAKIDAQTARELGLK
jgi:hypothetical protein